ncbi:MFS monosaccharide transporter-like protein [Myriangium duriaei CBS 260.36]|uniref:MFS monosaccharide transporter-like protein n=1 Tax=Myriangium duriaei CBS 260.36 TaxID=1168546 RepID=A0A9P4IUA7_9PEZI|nr:MFS monosaccharide transporter-like protein [Myriangium duriaei CBS 260.36]
MVLTAERIEAPVTFKAYLMCAFAAFAGILFGFDSGYINGVLATEYVKGFLGHPVPVTKANPNGMAISSSHTSLITAILSAGTFFGAIFAGALADWFGRRTTIIAGCGVFAVGVVLQIASHGLGLLVAGRLIAGVGVGFVSAINILYMSEVAPRKVRGAIVSCYQFAITIGLMLAAIVTNAVNGRNDTGSYRIPIGIQFAWAIILATGLFFLPESPRYYVKKQRLDEAVKALARVRGQPADSDYVQDELAEIQANYEYELQIGEVSWLGCFQGGLGKRNSNARKVFVGIVLQMMQQWTGVNFIFYYSTQFFTLIGLPNSFLISMITTIVNVVSTPISFYTIEKFGRRPLLIWGAVGMCICEFIVAITGSATNESNKSAQSAMVSFVCIYIFFFATTWGPGAWVLIGEIFPLPIRSKGVGLSTASNWFWNCIIAVITPYLMNSDEANLKTKVFFLWGSTCAVCIAFAYFLVPETKGLSLEQVDKMMDEVSARQSAGWKPSTTFAAEMGYKEGSTVLADKVEA